MQHTWTIRDKHGVVHLLPKWGVRSWKTVCGVDPPHPPPHHQPKYEASTCLICGALDAA